MATIDPALAGCSAELMLPSSFTAAANCPLRFKDLRRHVCHQHAHGGFLRIGNDAQSRRAFAGQFEWRHSIDLPLRDVKKRRRNIIEQNAHPGQGSGNPAGIVQLGGGGSRWTEIESVDRDQFTRSHARGQVATRRIHQAECSHGRRAVETHGRDHSAQARDVSAPVRLHRDRSGHRATREPAGILSGSRLTDLAER